MNKNASSFLIALPWAFLAVAGTAFVSHSFAAGPVATAAPGKAAAAPAGKAGYRCMAVLVGEAFPPGFVPMSSVVYNNGSAENPNWSIEVVGCRAP